MFPTHAINADLMQRVYLAQQLMAKHCIKGHSMRHCSQILTLINVIREE